MGNRIARKLNVLGIKTALDLALTNPAFIRKNFSVVLERTVRELNGESCLSLEKPLDETANCLQPQFWREDHGVRSHSVRLSVSTQSGPLKTA